MTRGSTSDTELLWPTGGIDLLDIVRGEFAMNLRWEIEMRRAIENYTVLLSDKLKVSQYILLNSEVKRSVEKFVWDAEAQFAIIVIGCNN